MVDITPLPLAWIPGPTEWIIIGVLGLLFFGRRLPEVGRSLGKGIVEFKKGLKGVEEEIETATSQPRSIPSQSPTQSLPDAAAAPRFDPYTGRPIAPAFDPYTGKPLSETNAASK